MGQIDGDGRGCNGDSPRINENIMGWGYIKSMILWRYDGILYATIYIYTHHCIPIYMHGSTNNWMIFLVQGIQGWQSYAPEQLFFFCSMSLAEIPPKLGCMDVYGEYIYVLKMVQLDGLLKWWQTPNHNRGAPELYATVLSIPFTRDNDFIDRDYHDHS